MYIKHIFLLFMLLICLCGCAGKNTVRNSHAVNDAHILSGEDDAVNRASGHESTESAPYKTPPEQVNDAPKPVPVNTAAETITIDWNGESLSRAVACPGNKMYFSQWEFENRKSALYEMNIGENSLLPSDLPVPEGMEVKAMAEDNAGHLHLLLRPSSGQPETSVSLIREIDRTGGIVRDVDISEAVKGRYVLWQAFLADSSGNYYIKDLDYMIRIGKDGKVLWEMDNQSMGISRSYAAEAVEDIIYISYQKDGITCIGEVSSADGSLCKEYPLAGISDSDPVMTMKQGTDSTLLLYGSSSGIWAWTPDGNRIEKRADIKEAQLPYDEIIVARKFLSDGRLLLVKHILDNDNLAGITCQYIPGGR